MLTVKNICLILLFSMLQIPVSSSGTVKKSSNRFSSRYRGDILPRGRGISKATGPPAYIPTVPTVTPSSQSVSQLYLQ